jgi:hypothetical protein
VRPERFELPTYSSGGCRSIQLSYGRTADSSSVHPSRRRLNDCGVETRLAASPADCSTPADFPKSLILIVEYQQPIARVVTLATLGAGNKAADVHSTAVVILGNSKAGAATARDQEHSEPLLVIHVVGHTSNDGHLSAHNSRPAIAPELGAAGQLLFLTADG